MILILVSCVILILLLVIRKKLKKGEILLEKIEEEYKKRTNDFNTQMYLQFLEIRDHINKINNRHFGEPLRPPEKNLVAEARQQINDYDEMLKNWEKVYIFLWGVFIACFVVGFILIVK